MLQLSLGEKATLRISRGPGFLGTRRRSLPMPTCAEARTLHMANPVMEMAVPW